MERKISLDILKPDGFDVLSAVWVFACNDENPLITYEGLRYRLNLESTTDVKKLVQSRVDLFRLGATVIRLERWKKDMCGGTRLPRWISDIEDETKRKEAISAITVDDVFRSQFRIEEGAPKSSLDQLDWGLKYIERLRKAHVEERETTAKSWQMYLLLGASLLNIIATLIVGILKVAK
ncbi:hypothetical protein QTH90_22910 [Variovorax sp. J2P1-59]|uniref:hypothetical protein n=1 Tax=Variovorax flavidus TaxID=3053501 RepID=UPI002576E955|nr:hypothetical protein [Variovorax sp. J2P1-59]MDM0077276.1 hypothetical protein [Variovorax sp. J2P1-59]